MQVSLFKKKSPAQPISTEERLRLNSLMVEKRNERKLMKEKLKKIGLIAFVALLGVCLGAFGNQYFQSQELKVKDVIGEMEKLQGKCANGSQPNIEVVNDSLNVRCFNLDEKVFGTIVN